MRDFRLPPRGRWELHSSGILRSELWQFLTDVSGQPISPVFKGQESNMGPTGCPETSVRNYHYTLRNGPEKRSSQDNKMIQKYINPIISGRILLFSPLLLCGFCNVWVFWQTVCLYLLCFVLFVPCFFVLFRLCIFILIYFVCTRLRTTATE